MSARDCNAELCPYWDGDSCPCATFGIDPPDPDRDPFELLPSATYELITPTSSVPAGFPAHEDDTHEQEN